MANFIGSPDLILHVIEQTDIASLLNLRATCRATWELVATYEASIATAIARRSFPALAVELSEDQCVTELQQLKYWSRRDLAKRLTLSSLPVSQTEEAYGATAEPSGIDEIRQSVENGWMVAWQFHDIARRVEARAQSKEPRLRRMLSFGTGENSGFRKVESDLSQQWLDFARDLSVEDSVDFELMQLSRDGRFLGRGPWSLWSSAEVKFPRRGLSWFKGCMLRNRPSLVADLWSSETSVREVAQKFFEEETASRSEKRILMEESTFRQLKEDLHALRPSIRQHCFDIYSGTVVR